MVGSYCVLLKRVSLNFFLCMGNGGWAGLFLCFFLVNFQFIFLGFFFFLGVVIILLLCSGELFRWLSVH